MALLVACAGRSAVFAQAVREIAPDLDVRTFPDPGDLADVTEALVWRPRPGLLARLPSLRLIVSAGAGVDHVLADPTVPRDVPLVRFVDPDLTARMTEWIVLQVLHQARRGPEFLAAQQARQWIDLETAAAHEVRVGVMGAGVLGSAALAALAPFGYRLACWSRSGSRATADVETFAGADGLPAFLARTDILVVLLPLTAETRGLIDARLIDGLSRDGVRSPLLPGPVLINAGRGGLQVEADILAALNDGRLHAAALDVFETEPLPAESPLWTHLRVTVTPHVAAETSARAISRFALRQVARLAAGEPLEHVVDLSRGY